ncbi:DUF485 domain-containing protein [Microbacterium sp. NPDC064584]|uniref:DUF485 domain-containing protein n=1 Tax=Microbacterium sp. NPDC064584 TaxID=3155817 RepID=UPI00342E55ED
MSESSTDTVPPGGVDYLAEESAPRFRELKRKHRGFVFPMSIAFLVWYFAYVLLSSFAPEFMAQRGSGDITVGLVLGLGQFVTTFGITMWYVWYANHRLDPISAEIREDLERQEASA